MTKDLELEDLEFDDMGYDATEMGDQITAEVLENSPLVKIEDIVIDFPLQVYVPSQDDVMDTKISDYQGKWLAIVFYPADFTFVCPTELKDINKIAADIKNLWNVEVMVASTDTVFSHKRWIETEELLKGFSLPMIADRTTVLARYFWILNEVSGNAERWTFIISPDGVLKSIEIITEPVGRSGKDLLRKLKALKYVTENPWQACPASWDNDMPVLKPSIKIAWDVGHNMN